MGKAQSIFPFYEKRGGEYLLSASFSDVAKCFIVCAQFSSIILNCCLVLQQDIMRAALNDGSGGNKGDFCFLLQFRNGDRSYIAHGRAHFAKRCLHIAPQASSIRNIGIHALFEGKARAFLDCVTTDDALAQCTGEERGLIMDAVMDKIEKYLSYRAPVEMETAAVVFSNVYGMLGKTSQAEAILQKSRR